MKMLMDSVSIASRMSYHRTVLFIIRLGLRSFTLAWHLFSTISQNCPLLLLAKLDLPVHGWQVSFDIADISGGWLLIS